MSSEILHFDGLISHFFNFLRLGQYQQVYFTWIPLDLLKFMGKRDIFRWTSSDSIKFHTQKNCQKTYPRSLHVNIGELNWRTHYFRPNFGWNKVFKAIWNQGHIFWGFFRFFNSFLPYNYVKLINIWNVKQFLKYFQLLSGN